MLCGKQFGLREYNMATGDPSSAAGNASDSLDSCSGKRPQHYLQTARCRQCTWKNNPHHYSIDNGAAAPVWKTHAAEEITIGCAAPRATVLFSRARHNADAGPACRDQSDMDNGNRAATTELAAHEPTTASSCGYVAKHGMLGGTNVMSEDMPRTAQDG